MVIGLLLIVFVMVRGYSSNISGEEPDQLYSGPVLRIRAACKRIENRLAQHVDIGNLDTLYREKHFSRKTIKKTVKKVDKPGKPQVKAAAQPTRKLHLNGVAWSPRNPIAFIDGERVSPGDKIGKWTVVEISANSVRLKDEQGNTRQLLIKYGHRAETSTVEKTVKKIPAGVISY
jgi:hypothetical protein